MQHVRCGSLLLAMSVAASSALAQGAKLNSYGNPQTLKPSPTSSAIDEKDLKTRLYQFADDSMMGRQIGRVGNYKGTTLIANEVKRLGLIPGGVNGTYYQILPYHIRKFTNNSRLTIDGNPLTWNDQWLATPGTRSPQAMREVDVIFGGVAGDTSAQISSAQASGKVVVLLPAPPRAATAGAGGRGGPPGGGRGGAPAPARFAGAVAIITVDLDALTPAQRVAINEPIVATSGMQPTLVAPTPPGAGRGGRGNAAPTTPPAPVDSLALFKALLATANPPQANLRMTREAASQLFKGKSVEGLSLGSNGGKLTSALEFLDLPSEWARNVIAIVPGSDPVLKHQYVAVGAHNDHVGMTTPVDKDSIRAYNIGRNRYLMANEMDQLKGSGAMQRDGWKVNMDSIRKIYPKPRLDSINNGADDDGSGSMAVLEMAEYVQNMKVKPKRSTIFIWHTGEEGGLVGSAYFVANPTVPLDSIVAQINIDMIGRGRADDLPGGGENYVGVVGSFFDSKDLGETVQNVNKKLGTPLTLDYQYDEVDKPMTWGGYQNIYGRSDHANYARGGVPIAFFFTGLHGDYHQRSDEPEFIDYPHYAKIANYIRDLVVEVGNGPRPRLNGTKPMKPRVITP